MAYLTKDTVDLDSSPFFLNRLFENFNLIIETIFNGNVLHFVHVCDGKSGNNLINCSVQVNWHLITSFYEHTFLQRSNTID